MKRRELVKTLLLLTAGLMLPVRWVFGRTILPADAKANSGKESLASAKVVQIRHDNVCDWDYVEGDYTDSIHLEAVQKMLEAGLVELTGVNTAGEAWAALIQPYRAGDKILLKPNMNNPRIGYAQAIMTSPQLIVAVVESLLAAGYPARDIIIYDLTADDRQPVTRRLASLGVSCVFLNENKNLWGKIATRLALGPDAPDTSAPIHLQKPVRDDGGNDVTCYIPKVLTQAAHLINLPVLKAHQFVLQSSALKNHFGTVRFSNFHSYPVVLHGQNIDWHIADINANPHIKNKTRLTVVDAIFGAACFTRGNHGRTPTPWNTWPGGDTPKSLFFSRDPLAVESVLADFVRHEQNFLGYAAYSDRYLEIASGLGLGIYERRSPEGHYSRIDFIKKTL